MLRCSGYRSRSSRHQVHRVRQCRQERGRRKWAAAAACLSRLLTTATSICHSRTVWVRSGVCALLILLYRSLYYVLLQHISKCYALVYYMLRSNAEWWCACGASSVEAKTTQMKIASKRCIGYRLNNVVIAITRYFSFFISFYFKAKSSQNEVRCCCCNSFSNN